MLNLYTNKLVRFYQGADGLKTGFTDDAMYTMAVTAKRDDMRLIAIVLGEKESKVRNSETMELLDYGFDNYKLDLIKPQGEVVKNISLDKASVDKVDIVLENDLSILNKKSEKSINYDFNVTINDIKLPLKKGDVVGKIDLLYNDKVIKSENLIISKDIEKISLIKYLLNEIKELF